VNQIVSVFVLHCLKKNGRQQEEITLGSACRGTKRRNLCLFKEQQAHFASTCLVSKSLIRSACKKTPRARVLFTLQDGWKYFYRFKQEVESAQKYNFAERVCGLNVVCHYCYGARSFLIFFFSSG